MQVALRKPSHIRSAQGLIILQAVLTVLAIPFALLGIFWDGLWHDVWGIPGAILKEFLVGICLPFLMFSLAALLRARFTVSRVIVLFIEAVLLVGAIGALFSGHPVHAVVIGVLPVSIIALLLRPASLRRA